MDQFYCPQCEADVGSSKGDIGIYCWKCGQPFGDTASTKPIRRDTFAGTRLHGLRVFAATVGPGVVYWTVIRNFHRLPISFRVIGSLWLIPAGSLAIFGLVCSAYAIDRVGSQERSYAWPFKAAFCLLVLGVNGLLLLGAIITIAQ